MLVHLVPHLTAVSEASEMSQQPPSTLQRPRDGPLSQPNGINAALSAGQRVQPSEQQSPTYQPRPSGPPLMSQDSETELPLPRELDRERLQRPESPDRYYHCSVTKWNGWIRSHAPCPGDTVQSLQARREVANCGLRRYDAARRIEETDEGVLASPPCDKCADRRQSCRVFRHSNGAGAKSYGYCRLQGKQNCNANVRMAPPAQAAASLPALEQRIAALEARSPPAQAAARLSGTEQRVVALEAQNSMLMDFIRALYGHLELPQGFPARADEGDQRGWRALGDTVAELRRHDVAQRRAEAVSVAMEEEDMEV